jgi:hypothetical protein
MVSLRHAVKVTGAILMLISSLATFGALMLACTMVGAVITHLTVLPASPIPALSTQRRNRLDAPRSGREAAPAGPRRPELTKPVRPASNGAIRASRMHVS